LKRDRRRMRLLDRKISKLDYAIWINSVINPALAEKQRKKRQQLDDARCWLRNWMKSYPFAEKSLDL
jgi:hypothetical protein